MAHSTRPREFKFGTRLSRDVVGELHHGMNLFHRTARAADGAPLAIRISGMVKLWKTRPGEFRVPMKYGMYENGTLTQEDKNWYFSYWEICPACGATCSDFPWDPSGKDWVCSTSGCLLKASMKQGS